MKIASFVGQKGGVGKSTLARVLAVKAAHEGRRVLLGDFDLEQLSCIEWSATRLRNGIEPDIEARAFKSLKKLRKTVENFDLVVVDTRGLADELTTDVSQESDVVFLPTGTSMDDLRPTLALARRLAKSSKVGSKVVLVLSKVGRSERLLENARIVIDEAGFDVLSNVWPERDGFQADLDMGRAGSESHNPHLRESAQRIEAELFKLVMGMKKQGQ
jgi:chromosome partitioning protein